jgi:hypothetical protein
MSPLAPRLMGVLTLTLAFVAGPAQAACPTQVSPDDLARQLTEADVAFLDLDEEGFEQARTAAAWGVPCLSGALGSGQAAGFHRVEALGSFLARDHAGTVRSFRSVIASSPGYILSDELAPAGHPLRVLFVVAEGLEATVGPTLATPKKGEIWIDGERALAQPAGRPFIFQHLGLEGQIYSSALVQPGGSMPVYAAMREKTRSGVNMPLAITAGVSALASGGLYWLAGSQADKYWDPTTPDGELDALRGQANALGWASVGVGTIAVSAGAGAFLFGSW